MAKRKEVTLATEVRKIGNSWYAALRAKDIDKLGLEDGSDVDVTVRIPSYKDGEDDE